MRPIAAWLAIWRDTILDDIVAIDPSVLLDYGDPQSVRPAQRIRAMEAYVSRYGHGGRRGLSSPRLQVHRFSSVELGEAVSRLWHGGIENPEIRELLLEIIAAGGLGVCADIVHDVALDVSRSVAERSMAIEALSRLEDPRLEALAASVASDRVKWPGPAAVRAVLQLFPQHISTERFIQVLETVTESADSGVIGYALPRKIESGDIVDDRLERLRVSLTKLVLDGASWDRDPLRIRTSRQDLWPCLAATCHRQCLNNVSSKDWAASTLLAIRLSKSEYRDQDTLATLKRAVADLPSSVREEAFWDENSFLQSLHQSRDNTRRLFNLSHRGGLQLTRVKDEKWVLAKLADVDAPLDHREMMLWAMMTMIFPPDIPAHAHIKSLKERVSDSPNSPRLSIIA